MINREQAYSDFVADFGWSTGRRFLLVDMMTEHREMLEDAALKSDKYIKFGQQRYAKEAENLIFNARLVACMAEEVAADEEIFQLEFETPKLSVIQRLVSARVARLEKKVIGGRWPC